MLGNSDDTSVNSGAGPGTWYIRGNVPVTATTLVVCAASSGGAGPVNVWRARALSGASRAKRGGVGC